MNDPDKNFRAYETRNRPKRLRPDEVSLTRNNLLISEELAAAHLAKVERVLLLFNTRERIVGIRPAGLGEQGYKLSARSVAFKSFRQHFKIGEYGRFRARFLDGVLQIDLQQKPSS